MYRRLLLLFVINSTFTVALHAQAKKTPTLSANKKTLMASVEKHRDALIAISDTIWAAAELALRETQSSKILADYAEAQGFTLQRGVAQMPTAFIASYGSGKPIIGVMGEFDALPGLSQKAQAAKEPLKAGANGHGCGHNLFGAGSLGAAIAIKELIAAGKIKGTVRFYGTPAEEDKAGKVYMGRAGLFDDLDVCFDWHPDYENKAGIQSCQAVIDYDIEFEGKSAHAAADPWNGKSALDAAELFNIGINFLREHVRPSVRIHYVYKQAGNVPNVIPDKASVWLWIRDSKRSGVAAVEEKVRDIAKGAALMAGVQCTIKLNNGLYEILVNETGAKAMQANMEALGPITYTNEETDFANSIMLNYGGQPLGIDGRVQPLGITKPDPDGGSSDVGDVSWIVPEISMTATTAPYLSPWHSWVVVACGGMSIGHKGMLYAAKALALTMCDMFENENLRNDVRKEFEKRRGSERWKAIIPDGPPPVD
ncbi:MAG TPA: amidohydrolase [Ferruginibacter sp.]|nr:amidohydrolase [Ferruginibacter sp.]HMP20681.1 amidohydrolase [Ferruginibacter sp.]